MCIGGLDGGGGGGGIALMIGIGFDGVSKPISFSQLLAL